MYNQCGITVYIHTAWAVRHLCLWSPHELAGSPGGASQSAMNCWVSPSNMSCTRACAYSKGNCTPLCSISCTLPPKSEWQSEWRAKAALGTYVLQIDCSMILNLLSMPPSLVSHWLQPLVSRPTDK